MIKPTPNPPETDPTSPYESLDSKNSTKPPTAPSTTTSARPAPPRRRSARAMYAVTADTKNEDLLANACETLASAKTIAQEFAGLVKPSQRRTLWGSRN